MNTYGICLQTLIPVRINPSERAEMVTQLLFGDAYSILETNETWTKIKIAFDEYEGWMDSKLINLLSETDFENLQNKKMPIANKIISPLSNNSNKTIQPLVAGSTLPFVDEQGFFTINKTNFRYKYKTTLKQTNKDIAKLALNFLNAPYLWGGKSILGIDCSGLSQIVYKIAGIKIPRDASEQVNMGKSVSFINEATAGDLAFFDNTDGEIIHVGIITEPGKIIHASGFVRLDPIDHQGIFCPEKSQYSHKLRVIKRLID